MKVENDHDVLATKEQFEVGGQAVLGRQCHKSTPWLTERHGSQFGDNSNYSESYSVSDKA